MAAVEVRPARGACHRLEDDRMSIAQPAARLSPERRLRPALVAGEREFVASDLRCAAEVAVVESADLGHGNDASLLGWLDSARLGSVLLEREMRARAVIVAEVAVQTTTEVSLIQADHVVEELAADGVDHAFDEGILPGGAWCSENLGDEHALHPSPKLAAVDAVAIAEEIARRRVIRERFDDLLHRPRGSGGIGDVEVQDLPAMMQQDHEDVEHAKGRGWHDEEVDRDEVGDVVLEEGAPRLRGWFRPTRHEPGDSALRDVETDLEQLAVNARRAPERIRQR